MTLPGRRQGITCLPSDVFLSGTESGSGILDMGRAYSTSGKCKRKVRKEASLFMLKLGEMIYAGAKAAGNTRSATAILTAGWRNMPAGEQ